MVCALCSIPAFVLPDLISNGSVPLRASPRPPASATVPVTDTSILPLRPNRGDQMSSSTESVDVMAKRARSVDVARRSDRTASGY